MYKCSPPFYIALCPNQSGLRSISARHHSVPTVFISQSTSSRRAYFAIKPNKLSGSRTRLILFDSVVLPCRRKPSQRNEPTDGPHQQQCELEWRGLMGRPTSWPMRYSLLGPWLSCSAITRVRRVTHPVRVLIRTPERQEQGTQRDFLTEHPDGPTT